MTEDKYQFRMPIAAHAVALMGTTGNLAEQLRDGEFWWAVLGIVVVPVWAWATYNQFMHWWENRHD